MKKSTILIYYPGGCYGTFFEWLYEHSVDQNNTVTNPFTSTGSSHNYIGNLFGAAVPIVDYINSDKVVRICRVLQAIFEKANSDELSQTYSHRDIVSSDLEFLKEYFDKIIVLHPTLSTQLWLENNRMEKCNITKEDFNNHYKPIGLSESYYGEFFLDNINDKIKYILNKELNYENAKQWGKDSISDLDDWELRELLSIYWSKRYDDHFTWWENLDAKFPTVSFISLESLKTNPVETILKYLQTCNVPNINKDTISQIVNTWLPLQKHRFKDDDVRQVVDALINNKILDWSDKNFNIFDEAYIQKELRDHGYEIKCFQLNNFPTNTKDFIPLLEKV